MICAALSPYHEAKGPLMSFCHYYDTHVCRSCSLIETSYAEQLLQKDKRLHEILAPFHADEWLLPVPGSLNGFRNKAKMVASPGKNGVVLGLTDAVSLIGCPLYHNAMQRVLEQTQDWLRDIGVKAYHVKHKRGELKYVLLTRSTHDGSMMLRFVLRSHGIIARLQSALPTLLNRAAELKVVSVNIQPIHMAILEGEEEIFLTQQTRLEERFNNVPLFIRPKSFFQTNPGVAAKLYSTAAEWVNKTKAWRIMDLFCGVGGFALHVANNERSVIGIEIEPEAIACALDSARRLGVETLSFKALDAVSYCTETSVIPELLIANPPRRGLGPKICTWIDKVSPHYIVYSSCNALSLGKDLEGLKSYTLARVQLFDMFPHTEHFETLVLLQKKS